MGGGRRGLGAERTGDAPARISRGRWLPCSPPFPHRCRERPQIHPSAAISVTAVLQRVCQQRRPGVGGLRAQQPIEAPSRRNVGVAGGSTVNRGGPRTPSREFGLALLTGWLFFLFLLYHSGEIMSRALFRPLPPATGFYPLRPLPSATLSSDSHFSRGAPRHPQHAHTGGGGDFP